MNKTILIKDIRLMLKDLKFQIFFLILVFLFILSAISSAVTYQTYNEEFQEDLNRFHDGLADGSTTKLINLLDTWSLLLVSQPSPAVLFSSYSSYQDKINSRVIYFMPSLSKYGQTSNEIFRLNWYFILGILSGFIMLLMSFEAISYEKRAGTLRLMSIYGFKRQTILWYKYLSYMLLYLIIMIPPALVSLILFFALTGTWSVVFMLKFLLILLISLPFASFFVFLGMFVSMSKNYRNAIVIIVFIWLFFMVIVPQSASIIGKYISPIKTTNEYQEMRQKAIMDEWDRWIDEGYAIGANDKLEDGVRARGFYALYEKMALAKQIEVDDNLRQTRTIRSIVSLSPFAQFENISEIIFDKGFYLLMFMQDATKTAVTQISNLMREQDSRDETSINLFYPGAASDASMLAAQGKTTFSQQLFEHPNLLFVTHVETDDNIAKSVKILLRLLPILVLNLILVIVCVGRLERLDIR